MVCVFLVFKITRESCLSNGIKLHVVIKFYNLIVIIFGRSSIGVLTLYGLVLLQVLQTLAGLDLVVATSPDLLLRTM